MPTQRRPRGRPRKQGAFRLLLQVRLNDAHMGFLKRVAREHPLTPAEAVRHVLESQIEAERASGVVEVGAEHPHPTLPAPGSAVSAAETSTLATAASGAPNGWISAAAAADTKRKSALSAPVEFTCSDTGVHRASLDGWQLSILKKGRMWRWYAHRGSAFSKDDPSGSARSLDVATKAVIKSVRKRTATQGGPS